MKEQEEFAIWIKDLITNGVTIEGIKFNIKEMVLSTSYFVRLDITASWESKDKSNAQSTN